MIPKLLTKKDIPWEINSYFSSSGKDLAEEISTVTNGLLSVRFVANKSNFKNSMQGNSSVGDQRCIG